MGYISGKSQATITLSEANKKTAVPLANSAVNATTTNLGTVPAGKVWRILTANLSTTAYGLASPFGSLELNGIKVLSIILNSSTSASLGATQSANWNYECCPVLAAGEIVRVINSSANSASYANITYIEEVA
jgi:hypothetical protein